MVWYTHVYPKKSCTNYSGFYTAFLAIFSVFVLLVLDFEVNKGNQHVLIIKGSLGTLAFVPA